MYAPVVAVSVAPRTSEPETTGRRSASATGRAATIGSTAIASITYWFTNAHESVAQPPSPQHVPHWFSTRTPVAS